MPLSVQMHILTTSRNLRETESSTVMVPSMVTSSNVDANLDNIKKLEGDRMQHCDGSMNVMSRVVDASLDNIKKLEGDSIHP